METKSVLGFDEKDFLSACEELDSKNLRENEEWEFFVAAHDVEIYRHYNEVSGLYQYKVYGFMKDVLPDVCAKVYMDLEYRKKWDSFVKELEEKDCGDQSKVIYWEVNYPWPMSHRDYVYSREMREIDHNGQKKYVVLAKSVECPQIPDRSGIIRVTDFFQKCALTSDGDKGSKAFMFYYDDPKGMIPTWVINWAAKTGVPQFLSQMQKACRGYDDYLAKKKNKK